MGKRTAIRFDPKPRGYTTVKRYGGGEATSLEPRFQPLAQRAFARLFLRLERCFKIELVCFLEESPGFVPTDAIRWRKDDLVTACFNRQAEAWFPPREVA